MFDALSMVGDAVVGREHGVFFFAGPWAGSVRRHGVSSKELSRLTSHGESSMCGLLLLGASCVWALVVDADVVWASLGAGPPAGLPATEEANGVYPLLGLAGDVARGLLTFFLLMVRLSLLQRMRPTGFVRCKGKVMVSHGV